MVLIIDITDAVVTTLNTAPVGTFPVSFTAVRRVLPEYELEELEDVKVTVVPKSIDVTATTRFAWQHDYQVDIGIQQKISGDLDTTVESLCELVDAIAGYLRKRPLNDVSVVWVRSEINPIYMPEHLAEQRTFTSVITLTYRGVE